jgi:DNA repair exonuclease SbcCD ATPase subunit
VNLVTARSLAQELLDIQLGSVEDAINLLDDTLSADERTMVEGEIRQIAWEKNRCPSCGQQIRNHGTNVHCELA